MKYAFIQQHSREFCIPRLCQALGVARSSYYEWLERQSNCRQREQRQALLDTQVAAAFQSKKGCYGAWRLCKLLAKDGRHYNRKTIANSLKRQGLVAKAARKFKATTNSRHQLPVSPNLLEQNFTATAPNQKWVGDITYLWTDEGWLYLAVIIDLFSRQVIGWAMDQRMTADLVCDALQMALWKRKLI